MSQSHVAKTALAAVVLSFGVAGSPAWAEEAQRGKGPETSPTPTVARGAAPGAVPQGFPAMPGMPAVHPVELVASSLGYMPEGDLGSIIHSLQSNFE